MRRLVILTFVTLDGIMQAPGGPEEDTSGVFKNGGWSVGYWDDFMNKVMGEQWRAESQLQVSLLPLMSGMETSKPDRLDNLLLSLTYQ